MRHGSLFSGIGGFDLAAEWAGIKNIFQVEIDDFCQQVLKKNFPKTDKYRDIKEFDGRKYTGTIDIISGGFPCQPFSQAGKRKGTDDDRHIFPEMVRVISEIRPSWVIAENVRGLLSIENGLVFEQVCSDLESLGYETQTLCIPAAAKNAPHKRERLWIIAHSRCAHETRETDKGKSSKQDRTKNAVKPERPNRKHSLRITAGTESRGVGYKGGKVGWDINWIEVAAELCGLDDGLPVTLGGLKLSKARHRVEQLKAYGNAIVPQIAYEIFQAILKTLKNIDHEPCIIS